MMDNCSKRTSGEWRLPKNITAINNNTVVFSVYTTTIYENFSRQAVSSITITVSVLRHSHQQGLPRHLPAHLEDA